MLGAIKGFEDIHQEKPYIKFDGFLSDEVLHIDILYVPPSLRGRGIGAKVFNEWVESLPCNVKRVRLMACSLGGSDGVAFWKGLGFKNAYTGNLYDEIENALVLGINGYSTPVPEIIAEGDDYRHWMESTEDKAHLVQNPQVKAQDDN